MWHLKCMMRVNSVEERWRHQPAAAADVDWLLPWWPVRWWAGITDDGVERSARRSRTQPSPASHHQNRLRGLAISVITENAGLDARRLCNARMQRLKDGSLSVSLSLSLSLGLHCQLAYLNNNCDSLCFATANYTGWAKKTAHYTLVHNFAVHIFAKYWPIFIVLSPTYSVGNLQ